MAQELTRAKASLPTCLLNVVNSQPVQRSVVVFGSQNGGIVFECSPF